MKVTHVTVRTELDVAGETHIIRGTQGKAGYLKLTPLTMVIRHEWINGRHFWRAEESTVGGMDQRGNWQYVSFVPQDPAKPLWVAALELRFTPEPVKER